MYTVSGFIFKSPSFTSFSIFCVYALGHKFSKLGRSDFLTFIPSSAKHPLRSLLCFHCFCFFGRFPIFFHPDSLDKRSDSDGMVSQSSSSSSSSQMQKACPNATAVTSEPKSPEKKAGEAYVCFVCLHSSPGLILSSYIEIKLLSMCSNKQD